MIALGAARLERTAAKESSVDGRPLSPEGASIPPLPLAERRRRRRRQPAAATRRRPTPPRRIRTPPNSTCPARRSRNRRRLPWSAATPGPGEGPRAERASRPEGPAGPAGGAREAPRPVAAGAARVERSSPESRSRRSWRSWRSSSRWWPEVAARTRRARRAIRPPSVPNPTPEEELAEFIPSKFRDSCGPEKKSDYEIGATLGIQCDGPPGSRSTSSRSTAAGT